MIKLKTQCWFGLIPFFNFLIVHICVCINSKCMKRGWQSGMMIADVIGLFGAILFWKVTKYISILSSIFLFEVFIFYISSLILVYPTILVQMFFQKDIEGNTDID